MNPAAAKEKRRSSERSRSYLKTRIRGQRLYEAAFILAIVELSRRLHQAYRQAYDKEAAEWLLPQNSQQLTRDEVSSLIDSVFKLFKEHPKCEGAINKILDELKSAHDAGSIRDILENFRKNGQITVYPSAGLSGVADQWPNINISSGAKETQDALTVMGEIIHSAGKLADGKGGYISHFSDAAIANVLIKSGVVMSVEQYRHTYADYIEKQRQQGQVYDYAESSLAHGGIAILCIDAVNGVSPKSVKP